ncbi:MAG: glutaconate CoA-transferase, partial [Chloroflexi bacterium]|nr:glutaconate CoA-transferase [Chloroflexota bacterium]
MDPEIAALVQGPFAPRENEGPEKVISLEAALRLHARPGMALHVGIDARAALCELARQWWGDRPRFTLVMSTVGEHALTLLHGGLVEAVVASNFADLYLPPGPSPVVQRAFKDGVRFENWSLYTHLQRLQAAALGLEFLPTRSLLGTTMAKENAGAFREIADPFASGRTVGLVKALAPDISIVHAWAADPAGNAIGIPADGDSFWGARAAKDGVIVTCERLVTTEHLRRHASLVTVPGYRVRAVVEAPFGAHPRALVGNGLPDFQGYTEDLPFLQAQRDSWKDAASYDTWVREWVLGPGSHPGYLARLGSERQARLRALAAPAGWRRAVEERLGTVSLEREYSPTEMMVVAAARQIKELVRAHRL